MGDVTSTERESILPSGLTLRFRVRYRADSTGSDAPGRGSGVLAGEGRETRESRASFFAYVGTVRSTAWMWGHGAVAPHVQVGTPPPTETTNPAKGSLGS